MEAFAGLGTPSAYLVDEGGRVARPLAVGAKEVPELARETARSGRTRGSKLDIQPLPAGSSAPLFTLPDLEGREVSLATFRGRSVLLLFSDPQCGACEEVTAELVRLARAHRDNGVAVVVVGRGEAQANRAKASQHAIEFPYLLQREWTVAEAYGTYAVPAAFLVDERGRIARDVAVGADRILALTHQALLGGGS
jgi:peroxiredoxin